MTMRALTTWMVLTWVVAGAPVFAAQPPRPNGMEAGAPVARISVAEGAPKVRDLRGKSFAATPGLLVTREDTLVVGLGELLFVELLANQQVVRIDEDLELAVKDIALLDAKKSNQSAAQQLDALLTPKERSHFSDRLAGWHASATAANAPSVSQEATLRARQAEEPETAKGRLPPTSLKKKVAEKGHDAQPPEEKRLAGAGGSNIAHSLGAPAPKQPSLRDEPKPTAQPASPAPPPPPARSRSPQPAAMPAAAPPAEAVARELAPASDEAGEGDDGVVAGTGRTAPALLADAALRQCVREAVAVLPQATRARFGAKVTLKVRFAAFRVVVAMPGGLPAPRCAVSWFDQHQAALQGVPGWTAVEVPLK